MQWLMEKKLQSVPFCLEDYKDSGNNIPRLFPCTHTVCERCLSELIQNNALQCPECRERHRAKSGIRSFPQNKYIITHLKKLAEIDKLRAQLQGTVIPDHTGPSPVTQKQDTSQLSCKGDRLSHSKNCVIPIVQNFDEAMN